MCSITFFSVEWKLRNVAADTRSLLSYDVCMRISSDNLVRLLVSSVPRYICNQGRRLNINSSLFLVIKALRWNTQWGERCFFFFFKDEISSRLTLEGGWFSCFKVLPSRLRTAAGQETQDVFWVFFFFFQAADVHIFHPIWHPEASTVH